MELSHRSLVLVGGPYKSGTSLLCGVVESYGFHNPAAASNAGEVGHGRMVESYLTRECQVVRDINRILVRGSGKEVARAISGISSYLNWSCQHYGCFIVLKDPYFIFTAHYWVEAAKRIGFLKIRVFGTARKSQSVLAAWNSSSFLTRQMSRFSSEFDALLIGWRVQLLSSMWRNGVRLELFPVIDANGMFGGFSRLPVFDMDRFRGDSFSARVAAYSETATSSSLHVSRTRAGILDLPGGADTSCCQI